MPEFGEPIDVGMVDEDEGKCPFDHSPGDPPEVKNDLVGEGPVLRGKMMGGQGTHLYDPAKPEAEAVAIAGNRIVAVGGNGEGRYRQPHQPRGVAGQDIAEIAGRH